MMVTKVSTTHLCGFRITIEIIALYSHISDAIPPPRTIDYIYPSMYYLTDMKCLCTGYSSALSTSIVAQCATAWCSIIILSISSHLLEILHFI